MATCEKRVGKNGKVSYRVQVRQKGFPSASATFASKTQALEWAKRTEIAMHDGKYFPSAAANRRTVSDLIDKYLSDERPKKGTNDKDIYKQLDIWKSLIGQYSLTAIKTDILTTALNKIAAIPTPRGGKKSPATMNRYIAALSVVFSYGYKSLDWLPRNPMEKVRKYKEPRGRTRYLSVEERTRLLTVCKDSKNPLLYPAVLLGLISGARKDEILSLKWSDVNLYLDDNLGHGILHHTKNGEQRTIAIVGPALSVLREMERNRGTSDYIFAPTRYDSLSGHANINHAWYKALQGAGIDDFKFHDLRHTAASNLATNGATLNEIADVLGHKTLQTTKRYTHLSDEHKLNLVENITKKIYQPNES